jgi:DNA-binding NarL/FixJ family response regulator
MNRIDAHILVLGPTAWQRRTLALVARCEFGCSHVACAATSATEIWRALRQEVHLACIDCDDPEPGVVDAVQMIPQLRPQARMVLLTAKIDAQGLSPWRSVTFDGIATKQAGFQQLRMAIDLTLMGRRYLPEEIRKARQQLAARDGRSGLSRRETELLPLLAGGLKLQEAASRMNVSYKTADSYRTSLLKKLGLRSRVDLTRYAIRERIIVP